MAAARAESVEFETVGLDGKAVSRGDLFLKAFDVAVFEFNDFPTPGADEMIVVPLVRHIIVLRLSSEVSGLSETCLTKEVERAVNGCQAEVGVFPGQLVVQLFRRDMFLFQKCVED